MANPRLTQITNQVREKLRTWPSHLPPPQVVLVYETHLPDDFDPELEQIEGLIVVPTLTHIRKNSVRLALLHEQF